MRLFIKIKKYPKYLLFFLSFLIVYALLLIPTESIPKIVKGNNKPFIWNQDSLWESLEEDFKLARQSNPEKIENHIDSLIIDSEALLKKMSAMSLKPSDDIFVLIEKYIFKIAPLIPVCPKYFPAYIDIYSNLRRYVKKQSENWDMNSTETKNTLYRLLYGNRTAIEEIMLQLPNDKVPPLIKGVAVPSSTPSAKILGVNIHSGDILVSRGGAPTSALIARGNDYPGNFSHIALVHISEKTNLISIIESHIEEGVTISSLNEYLKDTKLRIMVLRLRSELIKNDPMLPHKAAQFALNMTKQKHIPYDFEMNFNESEKLFCSEVASLSYKNFGISLWKRLSTISSKGTRNWLASFGVKYFETMEPSDLEYDPQLSVVAEWRDPQTLYYDHLDNATTDVMLEQADSGTALTYDWYLLPIGRTMKLYSIILNLVGEVGNVPEGMSAEAALRNLKYSNDHAQIKEKLNTLAAKFKANNGYRPPYWEIVNLARIAQLNLNIYKN